MKLYFGCSQWGYENWRGTIYPENAQPQDFLRYYSKLFNSVELNTTFYNGAEPASLLRWKNKTGEDFRFCPKIPREISHEKHFRDTEVDLHSFIKGIRVLDNKLGIVFLQLSNHFNKNDVTRLNEFVSTATEEFRISVELRVHLLRDDKLFGEVMNILVKCGAGVVITDSVDTRQYINKLKLTSHAAFVRFISYGHDTDYRRLDEWIQQLRKWDEKNLPEAYFFVHFPSEGTHSDFVKYFLEVTSEFVIENS